MPILFLLTFLFWIALNAKITLEIIIFGLVISLGITSFTYKITRLNMSREKRIAKKLFAILEYLVILVVEVYKANVGMIEIVLSQNTEELKPTLAYFKTDLKSNLSKVALANSITLTPGTITVTMVENEYLIHALDVSMLDGIDESIFVEKLRKLEE